MIGGLNSDMFLKNSWALVKDIKEYGFSQRTINEWNRLAGDCVKGIFAGGLL